MKIIECAQRSPEWFAAKAGIPSAASFDKIITTKGEPSKQRTDYLYQLAHERITGEIEETHRTPAMDRGIQMEDEARRLYEFQASVEVKQVGFCVHDSGLAGCSPDGLLEKSGLEIKCPMGKTHVKYLLDGKLPTEYFSQVQGSLFVTGFDFWDFVSYYPGHKLLVVRVYPDAKFHKALEWELIRFNEDLKVIVEQIQ